MTKDVIGDILGTGQYFMRNSAKLVAAGQVEEMHLFFDERLEWQDDECVSDLLCLMVKTPGYLWNLQIADEERWQQKLASVRKLDDMGAQVAREWSYGLLPKNVVLGKSDQCAVISDQCEEF